SIRKHVVFVLRTGILRSLDRFNRNFYSACDSRGHAYKRNWLANLANVAQYVTDKVSLPLCLRYGPLDLISGPLADDAAAASFTPYLVDVVNAIDEYIVENEKTARKFLKQAGIQRPQSELVLHNYGKHARKSGLTEDYFAGLLAGNDVGLMKIGRASCRERVESLVVTVAAHRK